MPAIISNVSSVGRESAPPGWLRKPGRLTLAFDIGILILLAIAFTLGRRVCGQEPAEDLVAVINSVTHPSFYYPGSNRIANLVGYAASWITDVGPNYQFQLFLRMFFAVAWPYAAFRIVLPPRLCLMATLIFNSITILQFSGGAIYAVVYASVNPYCTSLFFLMLSLLTLQKLKTRASDSKARAALGFAVAFILALIASAVAQTNTVYVVLAIGSYCMLEILCNVRAANGWHSQPAMFQSAIKNAVTNGTTYTCGLILGILILALVVAGLHGTFYAMAYPEAVRSFSSVSYMHFHLHPAGLLHSVRNLWQVSGGFTLLLELTAILLMTLFEFRRSRGDSSPGRTAIHNDWIFAAIGGGVVYMLVISQLTHVEGNGYHFRYFVIISLGVVFVFVAKLLNIVNAWAFDGRVAQSALHRGKFAAATFIALLISLVVGSYKFGLPTASCPPSNSLSMKSGLFAARGGYFAILGSYWDVWPSVFNAWKAQANQPVETRVFPTGFRAETLRPNIRDEATRRLMRDGSIKLLCVGKNKFAPDFGRITKCVELAEWNRMWGILPRIGQFTESANELGEDFADLTITLPKVEVGDQMDFSAAGRPAILLSGWSSPEVFGTWTEGTDAIIAFTLACKKPENLALELKMVSWIGAFIPQPEPLSVDVLWNKKRVFGWVDTKKSAEPLQAGIVAHDLVHCGGQNEIRLKIKNPQSLFALGINPDHRVLGIAVQSMSLEAAGP